MKRLDSGLLAFNHIDEMESGICLAFLSGLKLKAIKTPPR
jgi:hypothetical protein